MKGNVDQVVECRISVKFGQTSIRFWFFLSYLITTVPTRTSAVFSFALRSFKLTLSLSCTSTQGRRNRGTCAPPLHILADQFLQPGRSATRGEGQNQLTTLLLAPSGFSDLPPAVPFRHSGEIFADFSYINHFNSCLGKLNV